MQIFINANDHIKTGDSGNEVVQSIVEAAVERFEKRITRIEVHLSDNNGPKHGATDKRTVIEARVGGLRPIAVSHEAPNLLEAVEGAAQKLKHALEHTLGRLENSAGPTPPENAIASVEELEALEQSEKRKGH
jgi:ribosome-associated translation inhibitor RaiA